MKYDVIVIGGGPGGYTAAAKLARAGRSVCMFEQEKPGGTCLNVGCIPTKYMLDKAAALEKYRSLTSDGIVRGGGEYSFKAIGRGREASVDKIRRGLTSMLASAGVMTVPEKAELRADRKVYAGGKEYEAENIIIATGSAPFMPAFPGSELCIDSTGALELTKVPQRLCVIGGGVIGLELGSAYMSFGSSVEVIEMLPGILTNELPEAAKLLTSALTDRGMSFHCGEKVLSVEKNGDELTVKTDKSTVVCDKVLLAAGRKPRTAGIDIQGLGLNTGRGGAIAVDGHMRTNVEGIYAVGDVIGGYMLAHAAYAEADIAVANILGEDAEINYRVMPRCVYTLPAFAAVGMTTAQAKEKGTELTVGRSDYRGNGLAVAEGEAGCVFAAVDTEGRTAGYAIVGAQAPEMICAASVAVDKNYTREDWDRLIVAHPSLSETLKEAALAALKK